MNPHPPTVVANPVTSAPASELAPPTAAPVIARPSPDPRVKALRRFALSITAFTIVGHLFLGFEQSPITPLVVLAIGYSTELLLESVSAWGAGRRPRFAGGANRVVMFLLPTHIACLACAMLLYGNSNMWAYGFAITVGIASKYLVKAPFPGGSWRHTLNPSNTGIVVTLMLFPWVGIAPPYMFTALVGQPWDWAVPVAILAAGTLLNATLTGKGPLILGWVGGFAAQAVIRHLVAGNELLPSLAPMTGVAFILFTNYMITDPGSTPFKRSHQVLFGVGAATIYGVLMANHVVFGLFFALVLACLVRTVWLYGLSLSRRGSLLGR